MYRCYQMCRHGIRKARTQVNLSLARKNTTSFYRYIDQKRDIISKCIQIYANKVKETGRLVTTDMLSLVTTEG